MADIDLVIRIDEEDYKIMRHNIAANNPLCPLSQEEMVSKVAKGTPLPKGHGRLIDADTLADGFEDNYDFCEEVNNTPTIIEADKEERR